MHFRGVTFLVDSMFPRNMEMKLFNLICVTFVVCGAVDGGIGDFDKHTGIQNCCIRNRWEIDYWIRTGRGNRAVEVDWALVYAGGAYGVGWIEVRPIEGR